MEKTPDPFDLAPFDLARNKLALTSALSRSTGRGSQKECAVRGARSYFHSSFEFRHSNFAASGLRSISPHQMRGGA